MPTLNHWDTLWQTGMQFDLHPELIGLVRRFAAGKRVLEVGYGTGGDLVALQKLGFEAYGLESSVVAHERGKVLLGKRAVLGDGESMPFADCSFDAIFHQGLLEHFPNPRAFLLEQRRVLQQDGVIIIDVPHLWNVYTLYRKFRQLRGDWYGGWERSYSAGQLRKVLAETGFEPVQITYRGIWPHQWGKWLFPERIEQKIWVKHLLQNPVVRSLQRSVRWLYDSFEVVRVLSSYNVCIVAKRRPLLIALDARHGEAAGGGIKTYLGELTAAIVKRGDIPVLISTKPLKLSNPGARALVLPQKLHWWIWEQLQLLGALKRARADLFHAVANGGIPILTRTPSILTVQDLIPLQDHRFFTHSKLPFIAWLSYLLRLKTAVSFAKKILCTNSDTANSLQQFLAVKRSKLAITALGVSRTFFTPLGNPALEQHAPQKSPPAVTTPYILYHGGIAERKNCELLLRGFAKFHASDPRKLQLYITGENPDLLSRIKVLAVELTITDVTHFLGWVSPDILVKLVQNAECIVYPSLFEGFGLPVLEGMLAGKPVVASDLPLFRRLAKNIPVYFDPHSEAALASAFESATRGFPKHRLLMGQLLALRYTWQRTMDVTYAQYWQTLAKTRS